MSDQASDPAEMELRYEDVLPLRCTVLSAAADRVRLQHLQDRNDEVLRVLAALDDHHPEPGEDHAQLSHELQRLDFKVNLVLDLVSRLLVAQQPLPAASPVRLSPTGLDWVTDHPPAVGAAVEIEIFLSPRYPAPLVLAAEVVAVDRIGSAARVRARFGDLHESVRDRLEKLIFRHHRRLVAQARRRTTS